jgi:hypothetical protein
MNRFARPAQKRARARNGAHEVLAVVAIGVTLGLGIFAADGYIATERHAAVAKPAAGNDDEIYTGSILYMPDTSNICHQWLFDNHNGQFTDNGDVDCERAFYQGSPDSPKQWSAARVRVISTGFRGGE